MPHRNRLWRPTRSPAVGEVATRLTGCRSSCLPLSSARLPARPSNLTFVTDGIQSAIRQARIVARDKDIKLGGASPVKQALAAGLCNELLIHLAPYLLGGGVRLFDSLRDGIRLERLSVSDGPFATHLRYRVIRGRAADVPEAASARSADG